MSRKTTGHKWWKLVIWLAAIFITTGAVIVYYGRLWKGKERFTRINIGPVVQIESFDPVNMTGIRMILPKDMLIKTVSGRGEWKVEVLPELEVKYGSKWAADSIADTLGISYILSGRASNLWDKWSWWVWKNRVEWKNVELESTSAVKKFIDPDGIEIKVLSEHGEMKMEEWMVSSALANEGLMVSIVNTTATGGLGNHAARVINNAGIRVNSVANTEENIKRCVIKSKKSLRRALGVEWMLRTFNCDWAEGDHEENEVILKLGQEYVNWWLGG